MTIPNTFVNGTTADADEVNANLTYVNPVWDITHIAAATFTSVIVHSSSAYSFMTFDGNIGLWNGTTYTNKNTTGTTYAYMTKCKTNAAYGVSVENGGNKVAFTSTSGTNWISETVSPMGTANYDISMPTTSLVVIGGNDAGGTDHIIYSTDLSEGGGGTWNNAIMDTAVTVFALDMFDGTTGYAADGSSNILKTADGALNWADTNDNVIGSTSSSTVMYCIDADTVLIFNSGYLNYYVNSTHTITTKFYDTLYNQYSGFVETNGYIYIILRDTTNVNGLLLYSGDSGVTWKEQIIPYRSGNSGGTQKRNCLEAYDTGKIMFVETGQIYKQDRSAL